MGRVELDPTSVDARAEDRRQPLRAGQVARGELLEGPPGSLLEHLATGGAVRQLDVLPAQQHVRRIGGCQWLAQPGHLYRSGQPEQRGEPERVDLEHTVDRGPT